MAERARVDANPSRHKPWATFSVLWSHLGFAKSKLLNFVSRSLLEEVTGIQDRQWCEYSTGSVRTSPGGPKEIWRGTGRFVPGHHCTQSGD